MTSNQIAYWSLQETKRANLAKEYQNSKQLAETQRANQAAERQKRADLYEIARANRAGESIRQFQNLESARSNRAQESLKLRDINQRVVSNVNARYATTLSGQLTRESQSIERDRNAITAANNLRLNLENQRHNKASESISSMSNRITREKNRIVAAQQQSALKETVRHNQATELAQGVSIAANTFGSIVNSLARTLSYRRK